jgi:hypothetical protein
MIGELKTYPPLSDIVDLLAPTDRAVSGAHDKTGRSRPI